MILYVFWFVVVLKFVVASMIILFYNPHRKRYVLLDSGVTFNGNVGDRALLSHALGKFKGSDVRVVCADKWNVVKDVLGCSHYVLVSGGILKHLEPKLFLRKCYAVLLARLFCKAVYVDSQTVFLKGVYRVLFKLVFFGLRVRCRDLYSCFDVKALGLDALFVPSLLREDKVFEKRGYVAVDSRVLLCPESLGVLGVLGDFPVRVVPTMFGGVSVGEVERLFGEAVFGVCGSYHAVLFCVNGGTPFVFFCSDFYREYLLRKLSGVV